MDRRIEDAMTMFESINEEHFYNLIPMPTFRLSNRMTSCAGQVSFKPLEMALSIPYHDHYGWDEELWNTVGHEMVHLYLWTMKRPSGHTHEFKSICARIGSTRWAKPLPRISMFYVYACPECGSRYNKLRRYRRPMVCGRCYRLHNDGRYLKKFDLVFVGSGIRIPF
jgi:predicted SprT family Zn-dependent metalloprotease